MQSTRVRAQIEFKPAHAYISSRRQLICFRFLKSKINTPAKSAGVLRFVYLTFHFIEHGDRPRSPCELILVYTVQSSNVQKAELFSIHCQQSPGTLKMLILRASYALHCQRAKSSLHLNRSSIGQVTSQWAHCPKSRREFNALCNALNRPRHLNYLGRLSKVPKVANFTIMQSPKLQFVSIAMNRLHNLQNLPVKHESLTIQFSLRTTVVRTNATFNCPGSTQ